MSALAVRAEAHGDPPESLFRQLEESSEEGLRLARYALAFCPTCKGAFLQVSAQSEPSEFPYQEMLYPGSQRRGIPGLPEPIRRTFASAQSCFDTGNYEPCVLMSRKCVEATCVSMGLKDGSLAKKLRGLRDAGHIDAKLYAWAEGLRLAGNEAAHDPDVSFSKDDALDSLDFVEAILLYVFALDERFRKFTARRQNVPQT
jgi:hypothetical protein